MEFVDVAFWVLGAAVTLWLIQIKSPNPRFKVRISVVLFSVALFPAAYEIVYPAAYAIADYMGMLSPTFLVLAAVAFNGEQKKKHNRLELAETEAQPLDKTAPAVSNQNAQSTTAKPSNGRGLLVSGAAILVTAIFSYVSTLIGCPDGPNTSVFTEGEVQYSGALNGMSCFWAVPLSGYWGVAGSLSGITLLILGIFRLRASKR
jgi:hypothetical protein